MGLSHGGLPLICPSSPFRWSGLHLPTPSAQGLLIVSTPSHSSGLGGSSETRKSSFCPLSIASISLQPNTSIPESSLGAAPAHSQGQCPAKRQLASQIPPSKDRPLERPLLVGKACGVLLLGSSLSPPFFTSLQRPSAPREEGSLGAEQVREITMEESRRNGRPVNGE